MNLDKAVSRLVEIKQLEEARKQNFHLSDVSVIADIKANLLTQWMARGFIRAIKPASGSGTRNIFNLEDIFRIEIFKCLVSVGFSRPKASKAVFESSNTKTGNIMERSIQKVIYETKRYISKDVGVVNGPVRLIPPPVYYAFSEKENRIRYQQLIGKEDFAKLSFSMKKVKVFHVINFSLIAAKVLKKMKEI